MLGKQNKSRNCLSPCAAYAGLTAGDNAGCLITPDTLARFDGDARALQADNESYGFFAALDDLVFTGPTRTNVNDFRAIVIR